MIKKYLKLIAIVLAVGLLFKINANALSIEDANIQYGDVVIGNTLFNDWISANRAAKAGVLYYQNTGIEFVNTYMYFGSGRWKIYDDETNKYRVMEPDEVEELEMYTEIFYINNESVNHEYKIGKDEYKIGEEPYDYVEEFFSMFSEEYISEEDISIDNENVTIDYDNKTITCPYNEEFLILIEGDGFGAEYTGLCSPYGFVLSTGNIENQPNPVRVNSLSLSQNVNDNNNKVSVDEISTKDNLSLIINGNIEEKTFDIIKYEHSTQIRGKYLSFDLELENVTSNNMIEIFSNNSLNSYEIEKLSDTKYRIYLKVNEFQGGCRFIILNNNDQKFTSFWIGYNYNQITSQNLNISSVNVANVNQEVNNQSKIMNIKTRIFDSSSSAPSMNINVDYLSSIAPFQINNVSNCWIGLNLEFEGDIDVNKIIITNMLNENNNPYYEVINGKLVLWVQPFENLGTAPSYKIIYPYTSSNSNTEYIHLLYNSFDELHSIEQSSSIVQYEIVDPIGYNINVDNNIKRYLIPNTSNKTSVTYFNNKLYYNLVQYETPIFKDSESYKILYNNEQTGTVEIKKLVGYTASLAGETYYYRFITDDMFNDEEFAETIQNDTSTEKYFYYFFNSEITESQHTIIDTINALENTTAIDLSNDYYANN